MAGVFFRSMHYSSSFMRDNDDEDAEERDLATKNTHTQLFHDIVYDGLVVKNTIYLHAEYIIYMSYNENVSTFTFISRSLIKTCLSNIRSNVGEDLNRYA